MKCLINCRDKKAQQEIVGLVVIVLIVSVMGLVFFSFMIGKGDSVKSTNVELSNLLEASMMQSSNCAINFVPEYDNVEELIKSCYGNKDCLDGRDSCEVLEGLLGEVVEKGLGVDMSGSGIGSGGINKGFELSVKYRDIELEDSGEDVIEVISGGVMEDCSSRIGSSRVIDVGFGSGVIEVGLRVCEG